MSNLRAKAHRAAADATDVACRILGRRNVVRAAQFVLHRAQLDIPNDMRSNGESSLQRWILELSPTGREIHVLDVGANCGRWSSGLLNAAQQAGRLDDLHLHIFEPSSYTFAVLSEVLDGQPVSLHCVALSDRCGSAQLYVIAPGAGANSLHASAAPASGVQVENVATTTIDRYVDRAEMDHVTLVKIDAEGHDLAVLRGAQTLFAKKRISVVQFEYNHRWVYAHAFLRDAFELLEPFGYRLGKLTPQGVEFYPGWDAELEKFVEGNYVACTPEVADRLPSILWWKSGSGRVAR
jgi:FkbM family methyltransferase